MKATVKYGLRGGGKPNVATKDVGDAATLRALMAAIAAVPLGVGEDEDVKGHPGKGGNCYDLDFKADGAFKPNLHYDFDADATAASVIDQGIADVLAQF